MMFRIFSVLCLLSSVLCSQSYAKQPFEEMVKQVGIDQKLDQNVPLNLTFNDENGRSVELGRYFGMQPVVLVLVYYECPMICNLVLQGVVKAFRVLQFEPGKEFQVVVASIDPKEKPELAAQKKENMLKEYKRPESEHGWHFLTGSEESIKALADSVGFRYVYDAETKQYAHAAGLTVLTPQGKISRYFYGTEFSAKDLRFALIEASQNKIGTLVDQFLLLCYHYDPSLGRYGFAIQNALRVGGALTLLVMGGLILPSLYRERVSSK